MIDNIIILHHILPDYSRILPNYFILACKTDGLGEQSTIAFEWNQLCNQGFINPLTAGAAYIRVFVFY